MFVPVVTARDEPGANGMLTDRAGSIVIEIAGVVIRVEAGIDVGWLRDVLRAVRAAT
jgi:hypothetical protein